MAYINNTKCINKFKALFESNTLNHSSMLDLTMRLCFLGNYYIQTDNVKSLEYRELNMLVKQTIQKGH